MITPGADSPRLCETCNEIGVTRQFHFTSNDEKYKRFVVYSTHFPAIETNEHTQAMQRMDSFLQQACEFFDSILPQILEIKPQKGKLLGVDFETVQPTACNIRSEFILVVQTKFMDEVDTFRVGPMILSETVIQDLVEETRNVLSQNLPLTN